MNTTCTAASPDFDCGCCNEDEFAFDSAGREAENGRTQTAMKHMSYDLAVFDPFVAPREREEFEKWYWDQMERRASVDCHSPYTARSNRLQSWLGDMFAEFPPMNGPFARRENFEGANASKVTDYNVAPHLVYAAFAWSVAESGYWASRAMAEKHGVGFFAASHSPAELIFPPT
jgi:hypothetical protein